MRTSAWTFAVAGALLLLGHPASAQYYGQPVPPPPPPPPPQYYPPPPPPQYYPPPRYVPVQPPPPERTEYTIRASGGVAFASQGYYCYYYGYYYAYYSCSGGYVAVWPDVNLDLDVWFKRNIGLSIGANVMWGNYTLTYTGIPNSSISSTTWEPHLDVLFGMHANPDVKGRVRLGFGLYIASANGANTSGTNVSVNDVGGAFRLGFGASLLAQSKVGIGIDAIFEAGWIGSNYVSTVQLLIGPELHL